MYFVEIRAVQRRPGPPKLVPLEDVHKYRGFRSVFCYDEATAELIRQKGSTRGLTQAHVYADTLFVDFDHSDGSGLRTFLDQHGIAYEAWDSGGRSVHLHIQLVPVSGPWVPAACKQWVGDRAPDADLSFYHHSGQFRLPGTFHPKHPGQCKTLLYVREGAPLILQQPRPVVRAFTMPEDNAGPEKFFAMLLGSQSTGGRTQYAWRLGMRAAEVGIDFDEAVKHVMWWRDKFCNPPLPDNVIYTQVLSAYRRSATA